MTAATLAQLIAGVQDLALTVTGITQAPDMLPSGISDLPTVLTYAESGEFDSNSSGFGTELHTIVSEIGAKGADYAQVYALCFPLFMSLFRKIETDRTLGGTVQTYDKLSYTFNRELIVWSIRITGCKIQPTW